MSSGEGESVGDRFAQHKNKRKRRTPPPPKHPRPVDAPSRVAAEADAPAQAAPPEHAPASEPGVSAPVEAAVEPPEAPVAESAAEPDPAPRPAPAPPPARPADRAPKASAARARAEDLLGRRKLKRKSLTAAVPESLRFMERIDDVRVHADALRVPAGDFAVVALDWWLRAQRPTRATLGAPWKGFAGPGRPEGLPDIEAELNSRYCQREMIRVPAPVELELADRLERYRIEHRVPQSQRGDVVARAIEGFLKVLDG